jgi:polyisoprenoid-binding protein YceI
MKNFKSIALALVIALSAISASAQTKKINTSKSSINWLAKKVTGEHSGTVNFKDGALVFKGEQLAGGSFTVDMTSMTATDLTGSGQQKLNGHLKSDDFFGTEKFPTSTLVFKSIATKAKGVYSVTADLTIKGITKPIVFVLTTTENSATTTLTIDRTTYDIKYGSGSFFDNLGDKAINNDFELKVALSF